jgi:hypothetical protein
MDGICLLYFKLKKNVINMIRESCTVYIDNADEFIINVCREEEIVWLLTRYNFHDKYKKNVINMICESHTV